jgi:hypothetical protein
MSTTRVEKEKLWQEHIRLATGHPEGWASYCRKSGISINTLNYWRARLKSKPGKIKSKTNSFIPVQVLTAESKPREVRPDAKWVADIILHLSAGLIEGER